MARAAINHRYYEFQPKTTRQISNTNMPTQEELDRYKRKIIDLLAESQVLKTELIKDNNELTDYISDLLTERENV